jgi:predicted PurR-regulated permease PerM
MIPQIPLHTAGRTGLNVLLLLAGIIALRLGESVIIPMLIALLLASVLGPAAAWMNRTLKIRWSLCCIAVIFGLVLLILLITLVFSPTVSRLAANIPGSNDQTKMIELYEKFRVKIVEIIPAGMELDERAPAKSQEHP